MLRLRRIAGFVLVCVLVSIGTLSQTASNRPSIVVHESAQGVSIGVSNGTLPEPQVLHLSAPDRLVLDFPQTVMTVSTAERQRWNSRGVRMAFHEENQTTRVVFDIPQGQQSWMKREGDALVVSYTSIASMNATAKLLPVTQPVALASAQPQEVRARTPRHVVPVSQPREATSSDTRLQVTSQDGLLQVSAKGVPFRAILDEIASATGASVQVMTSVEGNKSEAFECGPAPPMDVIKKLFEGSQYNYLVVTEPNSETRISRIVVTSALRYLPGNDGPVTDDDSNPENLSGIVPLAKQEKSVDRKPD